MTAHTKGMRPGRYPRRRPRRNNDYEHLNEKNEAALLVLVVWIALAIVAVLAGPVV